MLRLTKQTDYALRLVLKMGIGNKKNIISIRSFAIESNISFLFLQRIARQLSAKGIIRSTRGSKGGYSLNRSFSSLNLLEIIEAVEGKKWLTDCAEGVPCSCSEKCEAKKIFIRADEAVKKALSSIKLN